MSFVKKLEKSEDLAELNDDSDISSEEEPLPAKEEEVRVENGQILRLKVVSEAEAEALSRSGSIISSPKKSAKAKNVARRLVVAEVPKAKKSRTEALPPPPPPPPRENKRERKPNKRYASEEFTSSLDIDDERISNEEDDLVSIFHRFTP